MIFLITVTALVSVLFWCINDAVKRGKEEEINDETHND